MILYVNGDSHSAGAELYKCVDGRFVSFKDDDSAYWNLVGTPEGREAHPECVKLSYGQKLADLLGADLNLGAISGASNDRVMRTTREYLKTNKPDCIVIGWTSWEREEWLHDGVYWQINAAPTGKDWPLELQQRHKQWVLDVNYNDKIKEAHDKIWDFHNELGDIPHLFFNAFSKFKWVDRRDWGNNYVDPYDDDFTYRNWLSSNGFKTVSDKSYHFDSSAHKAWAEFLLPRLTRLL